MKAFLFAIFLICSFNNLLHAQEGTDLLKRELIREGFENVRVKKIENGIYIAIEDNQYGWYVDGIYNIIEYCRRYSKGEPVYVIVLQRDIPVVEIDLEFKLDGKELFKPLIKQVTFDFNESWNALKKIAPENKSGYKMDLIVDPQLTLQNTNFDQIYHIRFDLAPVFQTSLWKGMLLEGQLIFPVYNDFDLEGKVVRPGFFTVSQNFRLLNTWFGRAAVGNFNANSYGADLNMKHPLLNDNWSVGFQAGLTGSSIFTNGMWVRSHLNRFTWMSTIGYYYPKYDVQVDLAFGRFINKDHGFRVDCTRHFGSVSIGFFATYGQGPINGGFHFAIPLAILKQNRKHLLRVVASKYFDQEYNANIDRKFFQYYETRFNENRSEQWYQPKFIKNELIKILDYEEYGK